MNTTPPNIDSGKQFADSAIKAWNAQAKGISAFFEKYTDADYLKPVAPDRNRPIYILGHLIAINDALLPLLGFGQKLFPELEAQFLSNPDDHTSTTPTLRELKQKWETQLGVLAKHFDEMQAHEWLHPHKAVADADFASDPSRNKLSVLFSRTAHMGYHLGQLNLFPEKKRLRYNPFRTSVSLNFAF
ncbi:MAG: DinB family protein [Sphingobacteriales bacterium]|nr:MAG: DinB family protein [Sphingobacteriales bacterium]